jgi:thiol reductant ABC exporter CydC subunit
LLTVACAIGLLATSGWLITRAAERPPVLSLSIAIGCVQAFALGRGITRYVERLAVHDCSLNLLGRLRLKLFDDLEPRVPGGLIGGASGSVLSGFVAEADIAAAGAARGTTAVVDITASVVLGAVLAAAVRPQLGGVLVLGAIGVTGGAFILARLSRWSVEAEAEAREELAGSVIEAIRSARELVAYGREDLLESQLDEVRRRSKSLATRRALAHGAGRATATWVTGAALVGIVAYGIAANRAHQLSGVMLAVVVFAALAVLEQCGVLPGVLNETESAWAARGRLQEMAKAPVPATEPEVDRSAAVARPAVALENATVCSGGKTLLNGVSLKLAPGSRVALIGPSGSGKTTTLNVVLHFVECAAGRATIGAVDVRDMSRAGIARHVGWLAEENHVFAVTLRDNLRFARTDASDAECVAALERVGLGGLCSSLPRGLSTFVGSGGRPLSAGESQRLAMARLLLSDSSLLLLDEPSAHLDASTGPELLADLFGAAGSRSVLVVSHDADVTSYVDSVVNLDRGRVVLESKKSGS